MYTILLFTFAPGVPKIRTQLLPPSMDLYTPFPFTEPQVYTSPVPKYMIWELFGSTVIHVMERLLGTPFTRCHCVAAEVMSLLTHSPPLTPPANTLMVEPGAKSNALVLPPTLLGPRSSHGLSASSPGDFNV